MLRRTEGTGGRNRYITTGVRWAESASRRKNRGIYEDGKNASKGGLIIQHDEIMLSNDNDEKRRLFETCMKKHKAVCNPIIDWTDRDVWDFLADAKVPVNPLYGCGFNRVGCIGCPMASKARYKEFAHWPGYQKLYIKAFDKMVAERKARNLPTDWSNGEDVFHWWMEDGVLPGQMSLDDLEEKSDG